MKNMIGSARFVLTCALALASPVAAQAQTTQLEAIEVSGRRIEEKLSAELAEYGHQVQIIEGKTIENMGFTDIGEALGVLVPGLYVQVKGRGDYSGYMMSGGGGGFNRGILWLADGVRINNRLYGTGYIDTLSVNMIERIEVLTGGEGLFYGTEATSGVVNIITKKPTEDLSGQIGVTYGTGGMVGVNGYVSESAGGTKFLIFGSHESWDGYRPFTDRIYRRFNNADKRDRAYDRSNMGLKLNRDFGEEADRRLNIHLQRNEGKFDFAYPNMREVYNDREEYLATLKWDHDVNENYSYYVKAYYHNWWTDYTRVRLDGSYDGPPIFARTVNAVPWGYQDWGVNFLNSYRFDRGDEILLGFDYQNYWGKDGVLVIQPEHEQVYAAFGQYRPHFHFWPDWKLALGVRYNYMKGEDSSIDSAIWNVSSLMPFMDRRFHLRANLGTSFILPTAEQLYANDLGMPEFGNPGLKPQKSFSANAGVGVNWDKASLEVSGFMEDITDKIGLDGNNVFQNLSGKTSIRGYTLTGTLRPLDSLALTASYTVQSAWANSKKMDSIARVPEDFASLSLQWNSEISGFPMGLGLFGRYVGDMYNANQAGKRSTPNYGDYWLADVSAYIGLTEHSRLSLYLANVFDKEYAYTLSPSSDADGNFYYENPLGNPFSATVTYTYSFGGV